MDAISRPAEAGGRGDIELVVIGGSAGAFDALRRLLPALPPDFVAPVVIVMHVPPRRRSALGELLARHTQRAVVEVDDKMPLARSTVYVAPPDYHVLVEAGAPPSLALSCEPPRDFSIPSIDVLFESAAAACGGRVAGIVLSGANEDGARGLAEIVAAGGLAAVQEPLDAESPPMPAAALARVPGALRARAVELGPALAAACRART